MAVFRVEREYRSADKRINETVEIEADKMSIPLDDPTGYVMFRDSDGRVIDAFDNNTVSRLTRVEG